MNRAKLALARTQKFVVDNKVAIACTIATTATVCVMVQVIKHNNKIVTDFLDSKGLLDEFKSHISNI